MVEALQRIAMEVAEFEDQVKDALAELFNDIAKVLKRMKDYGK